MLFHRGRSVGIETFSGESPYERGYFLSLFFFYPSCVDFFDSLCKGNYRGLEKNLVFPYLMFPCHVMDNTLFALEGRKGSALSILETALFHFFFYAPQQPPPQHPLSLVSTFSRQHFPSFSSPQPQESFSSLRFSTSLEFLSFFSSFIHIYIFYYLYREIFIFSPSTRTSSSISYFSRIALLTLLQRVSYAITSTPNTSKTSSFPTYPRQIRSSIL